MPKEPQTTVYTHFGVISWHQPGKGERNIASLAFYLYQLPTTWTTSSLKVAVSLLSHIISAPKYKSSEVRVMLAIKCSCIRFHLHFLLRRLQTTWTALFTISTHVLATLASQERTVVSKNLCRSPQEGSSPRSTRQGSRAERVKGWCTRLSTDSRKQKEKCWKNKPFSQSNIQDVYRSRGFWMPRVMSACIQWTQEKCQSNFCFNLTTIKDWRLQWKCK